MPKRLKILFVCARNQWRSPTAEQIYRSDPRVSVRSAGISGKSSHEVSDDDLDWADLVLLMERRYFGRLKSVFRDRVYFPPVESLEIPDDYKFMDPELIELIRSGTEHFIEASKPNQSPDPALASSTPGAGHQSRHR